MQRDQATQAEIEKVIELVCQGLNKRIKKHGWSKFVSRAEALGILVEEYSETIAAQQGNDLDEFLEEMMDVAISAIWAILSLRNTDEIPHSSDSSHGHE
jgi:hypothetical protein